MKLRLKYELIISFTLLGMLSIGILFIFVNFFLERQFREYSMRKLEEQNREIAALIEKQTDGQGGWNTDVIQDIGTRMLEQGLIIKVTDESGATVWDALEYNSGICHSMIARMSDRMTTRYPSINGGLTYRDYELAGPARTAGTLRIGYYGPYFYTDTDFFFIETINTILFWLAVGTLAASVLAGIAVAARLSRPIALAIESAKRIQSGDFTARQNFRSTTAEVNDLIATMNALANALGSQERLRRRLSQDVAHELRTPLASLQAHFEAMIDGVWEPTKERLSSGHAEVMRLSELVKKLQTLTHYESEAFELSLSEFGIKELIRSIVLIREPEMDVKQIHHSIEGDGVTVIADRDRLSEVIVNLLDNAIEFTPPGGSITLSIDTGPDSVTVSVTDTGEGIPEEDVPHVFERFYRAEKSRTRKKGGAGIGLAIVRQIVIAHGGSVRVRSTIGEGSVFTFIIPRSPTSKRT